MMKTQNTKYKIQNYESGIAVTLSILILSAVLAIALGASTILLREIQFARTSNFYVRAFFAADSGIEKILTLRETPNNFSECTTPASPCALSNGAEFWIIVNASTTPGCVADNYCIESVGRYGGTKRAIEVNY